MKEQQYLFPKEMQHSSSTKHSDALLIMLWLYHTSQTLALKKGKIQFKKMEDLMKKWKVLLI